MNAGTGEMIITYDFATGITQLTAATNTVSLMPWTKLAGANVALNTAGASGEIDWGCASASNLTAVAKGLPANPTPGTLLGRYAPAECR